MILPEIIPIIRKVAKDFNLHPAALAAFIDTESGGKGFADGKIIIQFEPTWMRKLAPYTPSGKWSVNKIDVQSREWIAFNDAFAKNPNAAMQSTSIGIGQLMGFHYKRLGYKSVGDMWDAAKSGYEAQVWQIAQFIKTDAKLYNALKVGDWDTAAKLYNGAGYKALAAKLGREPYNITMAKNYGKWKALLT